MITRHCVSWSVITGLNVIITHAAGILSRWVDGKRKRWCKRATPHLPRERSFNGKAIDIKGCISTEGRRMWENLRQRPVDLLLHYYDTHASVFSSNPQVYTRLKNAYYPRSSRIAGEKISGAGYGFYRGILPAYKAMSMNHWRCWNKIVRFVRGRERSVHYKYYDIDNRKEWLLLQRIKDRFDPGIFL